MKIITHFYDELTQKSAFFQMLHILCLETVRKRLQGCGFSYSEVPTVSVGHEKPFCTVCFKSVRPVLVHQMLWVSHLVGRVQRNRTWQEVKPEKISLSPAVQSQTLIWVLLVTVNWAEVSSVMRSICFCFLSEVVLTASADCLGNVTGEEMMLYWISALAAPTFCTKPLF